MVNAFVFYHRIIHNTFYLCFAKQQQIYFAVVLSWMSFQVLVFLYHIILLYWLHRHCLMHNTDLCLSFSSNSYYWFYFIVLHSVGLPAILQNWICSTINYVITVHGIRGYMISTKYLFAATYTLKVLFDKYQLSVVSICKMMSYEVSIGTWHRLFTLWKSCLFNVFSLRGQLLKWLCYGGALFTRKTSSQEGKSCTINFI